MADVKVRLICEEEGLDETREKIEALADAWNEFPPQVVVRNCHNCKITIYPSQTKIIYSDEQGREE